MKAEASNARYPVGSHFIYRSRLTPKGGAAVCTVDKAQKHGLSAAVEINVFPYFVRVKTLTPVLIKAV